VSGLCEFEAEEFDGLVASLASRLRLLEEDALGDDHHLVDELDAQFSRLVDVVGDDCEGVEDVEEVVLVDLAVEGGHVGDALVQQLHKVEGVRLLRDYLLLYLVHLHQLLLRCAVAVAQARPRLARPLLAQLVQQRQGLVELLGGFGEPRRHQVRD
jgi:hypothetical protein